MEETQQVFYKNTEFDCLFPIERNPEPFKKTLRIYKDKSVANDDQDYPSLVPVERQKYSFSWSLFMVLNFSK